MVKTFLYAEVFAFLLVGSVGNLWEPEYRWICAVPDSIWVWWLVMHPSESGVSPVRKGNHDHQFWLNPTSIFFFSFTPTLVFECTFAPQNRVTRESGWNLHIWNSFKTLIYQQSGPQIKKTRLTLATRSATLPVCTDVRGAVPSAAASLLEGVTSSRVGRAMWNTSKCGSVMHNSATKM